MGRIPTALSVHRFQPYTRVPKRAILVFAILRELILLLHAILRGDVSLEDVYIRVQSPTVSYPASPETAQADLSTPDSESQESTSTCTVVDSTPIQFFSPVRTLCKFIVQGDLKAVSWWVHPLSFHFTSAALTLYAFFFTQHRGSRTESRDQAARRRLVPSTLRSPLR